MFAFCVVYFFYNVTEQGAICYVGWGDVSWSMNFGIPLLELIQTSIGWTHLIPLRSWLVWGKIRPGPDRNRVPPPRAPRRHIKVARSLCIDTAIRRRCNRPSAPRGVVEIRYTVTHSGTETPTVISVTKLATFRRGPIIAVLTETVYCHIFPLTFLHSGR